MDIQEEIARAEDLGKQREPYRRGRNGDADMHLPEGKNCGDCSHYRRCLLMFGHIAADEVCDWAPSRFHLKVQPTGAAA